MMSDVVYMYRFLKKCKGYVRTKSHPEGSIMEGSLFDEALTLCSRYLQDETHFNHRVRNRLPTQICMWVILQQQAQGADCLGVTVSVL